MAPGKGSLAHLLISVEVHIFIAIRSKDTMGRYFTSNSQSNDAVEWCFFLDYYLGVTYLE